MSAPDRRPAAYRRATEIEPRVAEALRARARERRRAGGPWLVGLVAAAAICLVRPDLPDADAPAALPLANVTLDMGGGDGHVAGTQAAPVVEWVDGTLDVAVTPHRGVHLTVSTPEATVRVVGTKFRVERAHLATTVRVTEGTVQLACADGSSGPLRAGDHGRCLPVGPDLLVRLAELTDAPAAERLETTTAGLGAIDPGSPMWPELLAHHVRALADAGRSDDALGFAEQYLAAEGAAPRRGELLSFVARTRYAAGGCAARAELDRAARELPAGPEWVLLAACLADSDPERARALAEGAEAWAAGPEGSEEWRRTVDALRGIPGRDR